MPTSLTQALWPFSVPGSPFPLCALEDSEKHRLSVRAEHRFHRRTNLVQRAVRTRALEDIRNQVRIGCGGRGEIGESLFHDRVVACGAHLREPLVLRDGRLLAHAK